MKSYRPLLALIAYFLSLPLATSQKYWVYDGDKQFTEDELYMMDNCGRCSKKKHFKPVFNPPGIPALSDAYAKNNLCAEMYFPGCHYSTEENFCMKTMSQPENQTQFSYGSDIYQAFSVFIPENYHHESDWNLIYQFHGYPDNLGECDNWRSPPFSIALRNNKWLVWGRYSTQKCNINGNGSVNSIVLHEGQPIIKGSWTHFVIHLKFDYEGGGRCEVWLRDFENNTPRKIVNYSGAIGFNDEKAPYDYVSFGYYYGNEPGPDVTLYFDRIIFAGKEESLESMMYFE